MQLDPIKPALKAPVSKNLKLKYDELLFNVALERKLRRYAEVLSVCSVQYKCVTDAQKRKTLMPGRGLDYIDKEGTKHSAVQNYKFVAADGVEMPLEEGCSGFITMNPGQGLTLVHFSAYREHF